jgi:hypothetical protein
MFKAELLQLVEESEKMLRHFGLDVEVEVEE